MSSCIVVPKIMNIKTGQYIESPLFIKLRDYFNSIIDDKSIAREVTLAIYAANQNSDFIKDNNLSTDDLGETNIEELLNTRDVQDYLKNKQTEAFLQNIYGTNFSIVSYSDKYELIRKAQQFNENSKEYNNEYAAIVQINQNNQNSARIKIVKRTPEVEETIFNAVSELYVHNRIKKVLGNRDSLDIPIMQYEQTQAMDNVTNYTAAKSLLHELQNIKNKFRTPEESENVSKNVSDIIYELLPQQIVDRLKNNIKTLAETSEHTYDWNKIADVFNLNDDISIYENDDLKLEVLTKQLIYSYLNDTTLHNTDIGNTLEASSNIHTILSERVYPAILSIVNNVNEEHITNAVYSEAMNAILPKGLSVEYTIDENGINKNISQIKNNQTFINELKNVLYKIKVMEIKRKEIYSTGKTKSNEKIKNFVVSQNRKIDTLEAVETEDSSSLVLVTTLNYLTSSNTQLMNLFNKLQQLINNPTSIENENDKASLLRNIRSYTMSYVSIKDMINDLIQNAELNNVTIPSNVFTSIKTLLDNIQHNIDSLTSASNRYSKDLFLHVLSPFVADYNSHVKGKDITAEDLITFNKDISFIDRWGYAAQDSNNTLLRIFESMKKKQQDLAMYQTIEDAKVIQAAAKKAEAAGIKNFEFMYDTDEHGHKTGKYKSKYDWNKFEKAKQEQAAKILRDKAITPNFNEQVAWYVWYRNNTDKDGNPLLSKYKGKIYSFTPAQKEFYDVFMEYYNKYNSYLPPYKVKQNQIICIRTGNYENIKNISDISSLGAFLKNSYKNFVNKRLNTEDYNIDNKIVGYDGNVIESLPIYYNYKLKTESWDDMTSDAVSSLIAYGSMANNYDRMNDIINILEIGRDIVRSSETAVTNGDEKMQEKLKSATNKIKQVIKKPTLKTSLMSRLDDWFHIQVYGNYRINDGTWEVFGKKINVNKLVDNANIITSIYSYAINPSSGISNVTTGWSMMLAEALGGDQVKMRDLIKADALYNGLLPAYVADKMNRVKTNKLSLLLEKYNMMQENRTDLEHMTWIKKNVSAKLLDNNTLYFFANAGELYLQSRTGLALLYNTKVLDAKGNETTLYDALEVQYMDPKHQEYGAKLVVKKGTKKLDGTEYTEEDDRIMMNKIRSLNQHMHGIYNKEDYCAAQAHAVGQLIFMFKKYFIPSMQKRYQKGNYNFDTHTYSEGFYRTFGKYFLNVAKDVKAMKFTVFSNYKKLDNWEKSNIKKALAETGEILLLLLALTAYKWGDSDDDDSKSTLTEDGFKMKDLVEFQTRRLLTELQAFNLLNPVAFVEQNKKLFTNPVASLALFDRLEKIANIFYVWDWGDWAEKEDIIKSGKYKGMTKAHRGALELIPFRSTIEGFLNPKEQLKFYK